VFVGIAFELAKLVSHTLLDRLFTNFDRPEDFSKSTLNTDRILDISLALFGVGCTYSIEKMST
jgi:hypothetical protein